MLTFLLSYMRNENNRRSDGSINQISLFFHVTTHQYDTIGWLVRPVFHIRITQTFRCRNYFRRRQWWCYLTRAASGFSALAGSSVETESGRAWSAPASLPFRSPNDRLHDDTSFRRRQHVVMGGGWGGERWFLGKGRWPLFFIPPPRRERDRYANTTRVMMMTMIMMNGSICMYWPDSGQLGWIVCVDVMLGNKSLIFNQFT